jgi:diphthine-ammonia ligase
VAAYATCTGIPLYRRRIQGHSRSQDLLYSTTAGDEVEDLFLLLAYVKVCVVAVTWCSEQGHVAPSSTCSTAQEGVQQ